MYNIYTIYNNRYRERERREGDRDRERWAGQECGAGKFMLLSNNTTCLPLSSRFNLQGNSVFI